MSRKTLAVELSKLESFRKIKQDLEQYPTDSDVAATILWAAHMRGDIENKIIADFGAGTGILGIGCMMLGARKVLFIEKDPDAIEVLKDNIEGFEGDYEIINKDIKEAKIQADTVFQNPPFGTTNEHADKTFLEKAISTADTIYTLHKESTSKFVETFSTDNKFTITEHWRFNFPLKQTLAHHKKKIHRIDVGCWRLERKK